MEGTIKPPAPLSNTGDMVENWKMWKKDFMIFMELSNYNNKSQDIKAYLLRNYIGEFGQSVIQKIIFENAADRDDMDKLLTKLDKHFNPITEVMARYNFFTRHKQKNESIENYITDLKKKAEICNFGKLRNSLIRDHIIVHLGDKAFRKQLFEVTNLDLPKLVSMYNEHYAGITQKQASLEGTKQQNVVDQKCWRCNRKHTSKKCYALNSKCQNCGDLHHFTQCCNKNKPSKTEATTKMYNPNDSAHWSNTNLTAGNVQHHYTRNTGALHPSAPPPPNYGNQLYPNLNNVNSNERLICTENEGIQTSAATPTRNVNTQHNVSSMQTNEHKENTNVPGKDEQESSCILS